jgi:two-component system, chemotaxis family, chemotaxis protein CheY
MASILVIEDEPETRRMLKETLAGAGYQVAAAADGQEASAAFRANAPDLVVTDIYMPNKDGLEVIMELRARFPRTRIIAISGQVTTKNMLPVASTLGAARAIPKPFTPDELLQAVQEVLQAK